MSPVFEFEDKTVEGALKKASAELNVPAEQLKHDVVSYGSSGIFGLVGTKMAKIRVSVPEAEIQKTIAPEDADAGVMEKVAAIVDETFGKHENGDIPEDPTTLGREVLTRIIDFVTDGATVDVEKRNGKIWFNVSGGNTGVLIGKKGQTLEAMQYLTEKIINKRHPKRIRVQVDVDGYIKNRQNKLKTLAIRLGEKVKKTGKPTTVGQFNAYDRRIIHIALKDDTELRTHSLGDGYYRKLKIFPKKRFNRKP